MVQKEKTEETINVAGDESEEKSNSEESKLTFLWLKTMFADGLNIMSHVHKRS